MEMAKYVWTKSFDNYSVPAMWAVSVDASQKYYNTNGSMSATMAQTQASQISFHVVSVLLIDFHTVFLYLENILILFCYLHL